MLLTKYPRIWYHIQVPGGADSPASLWRDVRAVEGTGLENRRRASVRGFESHSLRQFNIDLRKYPRGRRGSPAKGVGWLKPARGFKSLLPRQVSKAVQKERFSIFFIALCYNFLQYAILEKIQKTVKKSKNLILLFTRLFTSFAPDKGNAPGYKQLGALAIITREPLI